MSNKLPISRRNFLQLSSVVGVSAALAACGAPGAQPPAAPEAAQPAEPFTGSLEELLGADMPGSPNHAKGWTTMLPDLPAGYPLMQEPVEISTTRRVDAQTSFAQGDSLDSNPYSRMIEKLFGVKYTVSWTWATEDEMNSKYNLAMASGDLPDYLETVPMTIFIKMVEADLLEDLTDAYPMYASQRWQDTWAEYGELPWTWSRVNGRIYGLPRVEDLAHNDVVFWYRADWFDELGLEVPTTLDELHDVAKAIVDADIGLGAPGTTIGLLANKEYDHTWYGSLDPIWGAHGLIPDRWSQEGDGLTFDGIRPEMKEPLQLLRDWYSEGIFRSDFFTIETSESLEDLASSQCGLHFTPSWGANLDAVNNDPNTRWAFANIPSGPNGQGRYTENNFREGPFCFRKGMENVDKVFEITNWMVELTEDFDRRFHTTFAWEEHNYTWEGDTIVSAGRGWMPWAPGPIGTRGSGMIDPRRVGNEIRHWREDWAAIPAEERDALQTYLLEDPTGVQIVGQESRVFILETADLGMMTELQRTPTPTMVERWVDLDKLVQETHLSIITGGKPLEAFDEMVDQWHQLGGEQVIAEVNEWWANKA